MTGAWTLAVVLFALASTGSPGPNNTLLAATGANFGFRRSGAHILGTGLGIFVVLAGLAVFGGQVLENGVFRMVLKWVGVAYLAWLALKIAMAQPKVGVQVKDGARPMTLIQAALFQAANPKVWLAGGGGILAYGSLGPHGAAASGVLFAAVFALVSMPTAAGWSLIGTGAGRVLKTARSLRIFNLVMAAALLFSLIPVILQP